MLPIMSTKSDWYSSLKKYNNIIIVSIKNNFLCILIIIIFIIMKYTIIKIYINMNKLDLKKVIKKHKT